MPAVIPFIPLIVSAVAGAAQVASAHKAANAQKRATAAQSASTDKALAFEREQEDRRRQEYDREQAAAKAQWDSDQARRSPYRELADSLLRRRAERVGISIGRGQGAPSGTAQSASSSPMTTLGSLAPRTEYGGQPARPMVLTASQLSDLVRSRRY